MSRSKKKLRLATRWPFWVCVTAGLVGAGMLWQQHQISKIGVLIKKNEVRLQELRRVNAARTRELAMISTPREIEKRIQKMGLQLTLPQPDQIVRLAETTRVEEPRRVVQAAMPEQPVR